MTKQAPAGWYGQPDGTQRYWDGSQWTEHTAPGAATPPPAATPEPAAPAAPVAAATAATPVASPAPAAPLTPQGAALAGEAAPRDWWKKKRVIIPGAVLVGILGLSAIASASPDKDLAASPTPTPAVTQSATAPEPEPEPEPTATDAEPAPEPVAETFTMPSLVGENLQDAQDQLQALGSYLLDQEDASGEDRMQLLDSNWTVCTQDPAPGVEAPTETLVVLASVKLDETCPGDKAAEPAKPKEKKEAAAPSMTTSQEQAVRQAEAYLAYTAFSKKGLIEQLKFEGFSTKDSKFAVEYLKVNWKEQAALKAQAYLDYSAFSRKGLIEQLIFEGFTKKQAEYGVKAVGL